MRFAPRRAAHVLPTPTVALFFFVAVLPVAAVLVRSLWTDDGFTVAGYTSVLVERRQWGLLLTSLSVAVATTVLATALGVVYAFALERWRAPGKAILAYGAAVPFLIPPYIAAVAWIDVLGKSGFVAQALHVMSGQDIGVPNLYSVGGVVLVLTLSYFPIPALTTAISLRRFDHRLQESASLFVPPKNVFLGVVLPIISAGAATGALFVFVLSLVGLATPALLQVNTYPVELYAATTLNDFPGAAAQTLPLIACGSIAACIWAFYLRPRRAWLSGRSRPVPPCERCLTVRLAAGVYCWLLLLISAGAPLAALTVRAMPLRSFAEVWQTAGSEIGRSLFLSACCATALCIMATAMAFSAKHSSGASRLFSFSGVAFLVSGPMVGMGLIAFWNRPGPMGWVYDSLLIVVLACVARFIFFAYQGMSSSLSELDAGLEEAAAVHGVAPWRARLGVVVPLMRPALAAVWGLGFVFSMREVDAAVLVTPPGPPPAAVRLFTLMHYGPSRLVAALSLVTVAVILAGAACTLFLHKRWGRMTDARN